MTGTRDDKPSLDDTDPSTTLKSNNEILHDNEHVFEYVHGLQDAFVTRTVYPQILDSNGSSLSFGASYRPSSFFEVSWRPNLTVLYRTSFRQETQTMTRGPILFFQLTTEMTMDALMSPVVIEAVVRIAEKDLKREDKAMDMEGETVVCVIHFY